MATVGSPRPITPFTKPASTKIAVMAASTKDVMRRI